MNQRGFSLVEMLIAVSVLTVLVLGSGKISESMRGVEQEVSEASLNSLSLPIKLLRSDLQRAMTITPGLPVGDPSAPSLLLSLMEVPMAGGAMGVPVPGTVRYFVGPAVPCPPPASNQMCKTLSRVDKVRQLDFPGLKDISWCMQNDVSAALANCSATQTGRVPTSVTPGKRLILSVRRQLSYGQPSEELVTVVDIENKGLTGGSNPAERPQMMKAN